MVDCRTMLLLSLSLLLLLLLSFLFRHCVVFVADCCVYLSSTHSIAANVVCFTFGSAARLRFLSWSRPIVVGVFHEPTAKFFGTRM